MTPPPANHTATPPPPAGTGHGDATRDGLARNAATVAGATLASRLLGYARDALTAHILGAGAGADAFFVAFRLPNLMRRLLGEGAVSLAFTPAFVRLRAREGDARAFAFGRGVLWRALLPLALLCLLGMALAHPLALLLAPGFGAAGAPPGVAQRAASLLRICLPYGVAATCVALCAGMLHAHGRFLPPALAPAVLNLAVMATGGLALAGFGDAATLLACGVLAGGVAQLALQLPALARLGLRWRAPLPVRDPQASEAARALPAGVFGASAQQLNVLACTLLASFLSEGSVTALYYAERLMEFPLGVFGVAVGVAALPALSASADARPGPTGPAPGAARHPHDEFRRVLGDALRLSLFISLPSAMGLAAVAVPLVALLFGHGAFDRQAVDATVAALLAYAPGIPAFAVTRPLLAACNARQATGVPVAAGLASVLVTLGLGALLLRPMGVAGPALAASCGAWANTLCLVLALRRAGVAVDLHGRSALLHAALACAACLPAWWLAGAFAETAWAPPPLPPAARLALGVPLAAGLYLGLSLCCRSRDAIALLRVVRGGKTG
ncbi:murein biosynthesis integral membrane protein MurJ [Nitratidesulfovibrio sp. HK-II]|uniref:murein biosynthesis integral membrane protein MurJ n=1 Tax=Nitratidesulfovibrio sp. HK-II TaxID=2009266 RepID=UPI000E2EBBB0|nr:murein biosynthesis integral membrane protein MurJ [Nitratidesulfovibrio sp. HK-II]GBO97032.1 proposed peptidoglycan lipid II flippase MurJ [Nitratidesulfovibrio sp. HK-II]